MMTKNKHFILCYETVIDFSGHISSVIIIKVYYDYEITTLQ